MKKNPSIVTAPPNYAPNNIVPDPQRPTDPSTGIETSILKTGNPGGPELKPFTPKVTVVDDYDDKKEEPLDSQDKD